MPTEKYAPFACIQWNEVTWYSRLASIIALVGLLPLLSFLVGERVGSVSSAQSTFIAQEAHQAASSPAKTADAMMGDALKPNSDDGQAASYAIAKVKKEWPGYENTDAKNCGDIGQQQPMNMCFGYLEEYYTRQLDTTYRDVAGQITPKQVKEIQNSFSTLKDTICRDIQGGFVEGGSIAGTIMASCYADLDVREIQILKSKVLTNPVQG
jgi:uncharacterized protein YecT (DUF1311 family)